MHQRYRRLAIEGVSNNVGGDKRVAIAVSPNP